MRRRHVGQVLEQPERENRLGPGLGEPAHVERAVRADARAGSGRPARPTSTGVMPVPMQTPNRAGSSRSVSSPESSTAMRRRTDREPHGPAHQLHVLLVLAQVGQNVEVLDLAGDLDRQARGVEALDVIDAGSPLEDRLAEVATANPVGRNHADSGHDHAVHVAPPRSIVAQISSVRCGHSRSSVLSFHASVRVKLIPSHSLQPRSAALLPGGRSSKTP